MWRRRSLEKQKQLDKNGKGSLDCVVDANSSITLVRWLDNGLVQLVAMHVGHEMGNPIKR